MLRFSKVEKGLKMAILIVWNSTAPSKQEERFTPYSDCCCQETARCHILRQINKIKYLQTFGRMSQVSGTTYHVNTPFASD
jgi:hypothetical protein